MKILLIEDDPLQRLEQECHLHAVGFDYTSCADAATALEACRRTCYAVIVADLGLPDMDGLEFCRQLRDLPNGERYQILAISTRQEPEDLRAAFEAGANGYLIKPVNPDQLIARVMNFAARVI